MFFTTPFSTQLTFSWGRPSLVQGLAGISGWLGSEYIWTLSSNNFSPNRVPPPLLLRKLLPSSALLASMLLLISPIRSPAAVGSRITVYLLGSMAWALTEASAFCIAIRVTSLVFRRDTSL